jgi:spermidine/putrescine transport system permease protein
MTEQLEVLPLQPSPERSSLWGRLLHLYRRSDQMRGYGLLAPTLLVVVLFMAVPLCILFTLSFWTQAYVDIQPDFTAKNYLGFFDRVIYSLLLGKSILIAMCVATATVLLAYPLAYLLAFRITRGKMLWLILITIPFWTSYLLRVFAWKITLGYNGVINSGLMSLGLIDEPLAFLLYNPFSVVITLAHAWAAFAILPIYVSLEKIDRTLLEAATDLGDGPVARFFGVTLPLSLPGIIAAFLFVFIPTVGDYVTPRLAGGTGGIMIGNLIQSMFGKANNWPMGAALAVITMATIAILVCVFLWLVRRLQRSAAA